MIRNTISHIHLGLNRMYLVFRFVGGGRGNTTHMDTKRVNGLNLTAFNSEWESNQRHHEYLLIYALPTELSGVLEWPKLY